MRKLLRVFAVQMFAAAFVLSAVAGPAHADPLPTDPVLAAEWQDAWDTHHFTVNVPPAPGSGMSRASQSISIVINAPAQQVFDKYSDFRNHIGRAAFLTRLAYHKDVTKKGVRYLNLTAIEDVPFEGQIVSLHTHAQQRLHRSKLYYKTDSWSAPGIFTHQKIVFKKLTPTKTEVTEHLTFDAPDELIDVAVTSGTASHQQTQAGLKQAIESGEI